MGEWIMESGLDSSLIGLKTQPRETHSSSSYDASLPHN